MPTVKSLASVSNYIGHAINVKSRNFLIDTWTDLVNTTPVKTGKARYSWKISPGIPFTKEIPDGNYPYPPVPDLSKYTRNYTQWFIANTAPYIGDLNQGTSTQAPAGFIQLAILKNVIRYG